MNLNTAGATAHEPNGRLGRPDFKNSMLYKPLPFVFLLNEN
jgi:hypothetical protein